MKIKYFVYKLYTLLFLDKKINLSNSLEALTSLWCRWTSLHIILNSLVTLNFTVYSHSTVVDVLHLSSGYILNFL